MLRNKRVKLDRIDQLIKKSEQVLDRDRDRRLWTGVLGLGLLVYSVNVQWTIGLVLAALLLFVLFPTFVFFSNRSLRQMERNKAWREFLERQNFRLSANWQELDKTLRRYSDAKDDIDLLGWPSLYSYLDETVSDKGARRLAESLTEPDINLERIHRRQNQVLELSKSRYQLRQLILCCSDFPEKLASDKISQYIQKPTVEEGFSKRAALGFGLWSLSGASYLCHIWYPVWPLPALLYLGYVLFSVFILGEVARGFQSALSIDRHYQPFAKFSSLLEKFCKTDSIFAKICQQTDQNRPSKELKRFSRIISLLSIQANPLVFLSVNAVVPWTLFFTWRIEESRKRLSGFIGQTIDEIAELEVLWCLSFLYTYHSKTMPQVRPELNFSVEDLQHPLIAPDKVITNNFSFQENCKIGLITGSNMSGKSTFLRTVGLNQTLAMCGAPVFAETMTTYPAVVASCLRVSDSVESGFSYFYAEVRRIRDIVKSLEGGSSVFLLIDEVFKGTNNRERLIAAQSLLQKLSRFDSLGFVTTHDLELSELSLANRSIRNFHFSDRFVDGEMVFDYTIKEGPCTSTNALKILQKEGLPVEVQES